MAWFILLLAGLAETAWVIGLKYTHGFTRPIPSVLTAAMMIVSFALLAQAVKTIPVGTGYAVWVGIGATGAFLLGMIFFDEPRDLLRIGCVLLIILGVMGLKFTDHTLSQESGAAGAETLAAIVHEEDEA